MHMCCLQVCWEKFTRYFDVEEKFVHLTNDCFVLTPEKAIELVDENTIGQTIFFFSWLSLIFMAVSSCPLWMHVAQEV